jgi:putative acetyltransferase
VPSLLVGHIAFSPVTVDGDDGGALGLAPMGVRPAWQRRGVGRALVDAGLAELRLRRPAVPFVVVVGHASYYPRHFGFVPGARFGLRWEGGHDESFFVLPLGAPERAVPGGVVRYRPEVA